MRTVIFFFYSIRKDPRGIIEDISWLHPLYIRAWYVLNISPYLTRWNSIMGRKNKFRRKFVETEFPEVGLEGKMSTLRKTGKIYAPVSRKCDKSRVSKTNSAYFERRNFLIKVIFVIVFANQNSIDFSKIHRRGKFKKKKLILLKLNPNTNLY